MQSAKNILDLKKNRNAFLMKLSKFSFFCRTFGIFTSSKSLNYAILQKEAFFTSISLTPRKFSRFWYTYSDTKTSNNILH